MRQQNHNQVSDTELIKLYSTSQGLKGQVAISEPTVFCRIKFNDRIQSHYFQKKGKGDFEIFAL